jgi:hypothetical protein
MNDREGGNMSESNIWREVELPEGTELLRRELYDFNSEKGQFQIELFETINGKYFAIGTEKDPDAKMIIYGSDITNDKRKALQVVIEKISREGAWS